MSNEHHYHLHGLRIRSEFGLPEPECQEGHQTDLVFLDGGIETVPCTPPDGEILSWVKVPGAESMAIAERSGRTVYWVPKLGYFSSLDRGATWVATGDPEVDQGYLPLILVGGVMALAITLRSEIALHASGVVLPGEVGVTAVVATTNGGKTTLAALACAAGARLVSDDLLRVVTAEGAVTTFAGSSELRVRTGSVQPSVLFDQEQLRTTTDGRIAVKPPHASQEILPLIRIVTPVVVPYQTAPEARGVDPLSSLLTLLGNLRLPGLRSTTLHHVLLDSLLAVSRTVPTSAVRLSVTPRFSINDAEQITNLLQRCSAQHP
jgi:hypothetical protein